MSEKQKTKTYIIVLVLGSFLLAGVLKAADTVAPVVTSFAVPANSSSLTVPITVFTANDDVLVTEYFVSENPSQPDSLDSAWIPAVPGTYTFATEGPKTLYAWARDAAGNISLSSLSSSVNISTASDIITPSAPAFLSVQ